MRVGTMPLSQTALDFAANMIGGRPCAKCGSPMIVAMTKPAELRYDLRTFECVKCGRVEKIPVPSRSSKWRDSHLQPPK